MNNLLNTLLEEKEKLDKLYQMEEQHRKRIHENLDTLTIDQIKEMSLEDKILLRETFLLSIDDMNERSFIHRNPKRLNQRKWSCNTLSIFKRIDVLDKRTNL